MSKKYCIGIDIGTKSVRAALVNLENGKIESSHSHHINVFEPKPNFFEQSSKNIYSSLLICVKKVINGINNDDIMGIGIDATCSLVCVDKNLKPLCISPSGDPERNIILWADHRSMEQAKHKVLNFVGSKISPEMESMYFFQFKSEAPKLLWICENLPDVWNRDGNKYFDLADYFVFKFTGNDVRSTCTTVCKWTYVGKWDPTYFNQIGLKKVVEEKFNSIGTKVCPIGTCVGNLTSEVAKDLGLNEKTVVSTGIIDAHAAGIGIIGAKTKKMVPLESRIGIIAGTSCCHMAISKEPCFVGGIWGPYENAMIPGYHLNEGGQSAVGKLIDHVIESHTYYSTLKKESVKSGKSIYEMINENLEKMKEKENVEFMSYLTKDVNILPYFHGNRSPIADPNLKGMVCGLTISKSLEDLCLLYLSVVQSLVYGTKHIMEELEKNGYKPFQQIFLCGGLCKNDIYVKENANILQMKIYLPREDESACVGSAILGSVAAKFYKNVEEAMEKMNGIDKVIDFDKNKDLVEYHRKKYKIFKLMYQHQIEYKKIMNEE